MDLEANNVFGMNSRRKTPERPLMRGTWVTMRLTDGTQEVVRFVVVGRGYWRFDHGAYGTRRDDFWMPEGLIARITPAQRPCQVLSFTDPFGKRWRVGRYATLEEARGSIRYLLKACATDIRFEAAA